MRSTDKSVQTVLQYIRSKWDRSINTDEHARGIVLPYPYTTPCMKDDGHFRMFFYWDTFFTNLGLLRNDRIAQAKNNIKNILWFINEQGYMPNHTGIHDRSQPPYLHLMVRDFFAATPETDDVFFRECAEGIRKEYQFWMTARHDRCGLNHYGYHGNEKDILELYKMACRRLKIEDKSSEQEKVYLGRQYLAEAESGWDFCQRFSSRCLDHAAVDLNALLFGYEDFLYRASKKCGWHYTDLYQDSACKRKELINRYHWNDTRGWYFDFDIVNRKQSDVYSLAGILPFFMGIADMAQAKKMVKNLPLFERDWGLAATAEHDGCHKYQWAYPVVWPPLVYCAVMGLERYGFREDARRVAGKYLDTAVAQYKETGRLWEKYNAITGAPAETEYGCSPMLGWTAGVFVALAEYLLPTNAADDPAQPV